MPKRLRGWANPACSVPLYRPLTEEEEEVARRIALRLPPPLTEEQEVAARVAEAAAAAEGLPLLRSDEGSSGFKHIKFDPDCRRRPYQLAHRKKSKGYYSTPHEAALAYSRLVGREAAWAEAQCQITGAAAASSDVPMTADEARAAAGLPALATLPMLDTRMPPRAARRPGCVVVLDEARLLKI